MSGFKCRVLGFQGLGLGIRIFRSLEALGLVLQGVRSLGCGVLAVKLRSFKEIRALGRRAPNLSTGFGDRIWVVL